MNFCKIRREYQWQNQVATAQAETAGVKAETGEAVRAGGLRDGQVKTLESLLVVVEKMLHLKGKANDD